MTNVTTHKIAIVEDELSIQQMYKFKFEAEGFRVVVASDGRTGLQVVKDFRPDILLLDIKMPHMDGDEMLAKLRATAWGANIRVVILTNLSKDEAPTALRFLHVDRYIVKAHHTPAQVLAVTKEILDIAS